MTTTTYATYRIRVRRPRETGQLVAVRFVNGRPTGAIDTLAGIPPETWGDHDFDDDRELIAAALGPDYEDYCED